MRLRCLSCEHVWTEPGPRVGESLDEVLLIRRESGLDGAVNDRECDTGKGEIVSERATRDHRGAGAPISVEMRELWTGARPRGEGRIRAGRGGLREVREEGHGRRTAGEARPGRAPFNGYGQEWTRYWTGWKSLDGALAPDSAGYSSHWRWQMRRVIAVAAVWWLMTGWAFSPDSQVIGGPFQIFGQCNQAGNHLPYQYYVSGWHCESD
jgi:hypothetical protein